MVSQGRVNQGMMWEGERPLLVLWGGRLDTRQNTIFHIGPRRMAPDRILQYVRLPLPFYMCMGPIESIWLHYRVMGGAVVWKNRSLEQHSHVWPNTDSNWQDSTKHKATPPFQHLWRTHWRHFTSLQCHGGYSSVEKPVLGQYLPCLVQYGWHLTDDYNG